MKALRMILLSLLVIGSAGCVGEMTETASKLPAEFWKEEAGKLRERLDIARKELESHRQQSDYLMFSLAVSSQFVPPFAESAAARIWFESELGEPSMSMADRFSEWRKLMNDVRRDPGVTVPADLRAPKLAIWIEQFAEPTLEEAREVALRLSPFIDRLKKKIVCVDEKEVNSLRQDLTDLSERLFQLHCTCPVAWR